MRQEDLHAGAQTPERAGPEPVLIGAGGAVGRRVCRAWAGDGVAPVTIGRGAGADLRWDMLGPPPPCPAAAGAGIVVMAGVTPLTGGALEDNTRLALVGIAAARAWGAAHVFVLSSSSVYGPTPRASVDEHRTPAPQGAYAASKLAMERAAAGPGVTALRLANVAGASQPFLSITAGGPPRLDAFPGLPDAPMRSFIGPVALARGLAALCDAAARGVALPPVLNLAARDPLPMDAIFAARGIRPERVAAPEGAMPFVNLSTTRLAQFWAPPRQDAATLWDEVRATGGDVA